MEVIAVQAEVEARFGVSLKDCALDDKSGRLFYLTPAGERGEPMKKTKTRSTRVR